jgi:hypothetical protein
MGCAFGKADLFSQFAETKSLWLLAEMNQQVINALNGLN